MLLLLANFVALARIQARVCFFCGEGAAKSISTTVVRGPTVRKKKDVHHVDYLNVSWAFLQYLELDDLPESSSVAPNSDPCHVTVKMVPSSVLSFFLVLEFPVQRFDSIQLNLI